jgi:hypothetical protein
MMGRLIRSVGGPQVLLGVIIATGFVVVPVGFVIGDQIAKVWPAADSLAGRVVVLGIAWVLLTLWAIWDR